MLSPPCHPSTYGDDTFTFWPVHIAMFIQKESEQFQYANITTKCQRLSCKCQSYILSHFSRLPILSGYSLLIEDAPQYLPCNYLPSLLQGKIVITNRSDAPAIVVGTCNDSLFYQVLNAYGELERLRDTSFTVVDRVKAEEVETFVELVGLANLIYVRIKGVSLREGEEPRFIIE